MVDFAQRGQSDETACVVRNEAIAEKMKTGDGSVLPVALVRPVMLVGSLFPVATCQNADALLPTVDQ